jgi:hypothetical protein
VKSASSIVCGSADPIIGAGAPECSVRKDESAPANAAVDGLKKLAGGYCGGK